MDSGWSWPEPRVPAHNESSLGGWPPLYDIIYKEKKAKGDKNDVHIIEGFD